MNSKPKQKKKINLCYYSTLQNPIEFDNDPMPKLICDYSDILSILESEKDEIMKFLLFNKSSINKILYVTEEEIRITNLKQLKMSEVLYFSFLILENKELVNYIYPINFVYEINNLTKTNEKFSKKIILSKIVILLIYNYRESFLYKPQESNELETLEEENGEIAKQCQYVKGNLRDLLLNSIKSNEIYDYYTRIIINIIRSNKFKSNDWNDIKKLIEELELETINITKNMFDDIYKVLDIKEKYIQSFIISNKDDLFNEKKINFYYFLLKYVFKNPFYIYQIPLFLNTRKKIINLIIKNNFNQLCIFNVNNYKDKIEYVIRTLTDSEYYYKKYIEFDVNPLKIVLFYYKNYLFESKKSDINTIEEIIEKKSVGNVNKNYLKDLNLAKEMKNKYPVIKYLFDLKRIKEGIQKTEVGLKKFMEGWEKIERMIKSRKFKKMIKSMKISLINYFKDINNRGLLLKIFEKDSYLYFIERNLDYLDFDKYLIDLNNISELNLDNKNISKNKTNKNELKENEIINFMKQKIITTDLSYMITENLYKNENNLLKINKKVSPSQIIGFTKIMERYECSAEFVKELSNGFFVCGSGGGEKNSVSIYNQFCEKIIDINGLDDVSYNVYEINENNENKNKDIIQLIICLNHLVYNIYLYIKENNVYIELYNTTSCKLFLEMEDNNSIIAGDKGAIYSNNLFREDKNKKNKISNIILDKSIKGGIRINGYMASLIAKNDSKNGEDILIFYNCKTNDIIKQIEGYLFNNNSNGLCFIPNEETEIKNKMLLCACKKNLKEKISGILLINIDNFKEKEYYYELDNYIVKCFCPILFVNNKNSRKGDITKKENITITNTDYFFVGGYDIGKKKGTVKLFKFLYDDKNEKIKFIQDLLIENDDYFKGFEKPISCIIQYKITGNLLITSLDGKVALFYPPNIDDYLYNDSKVEKN